MDEERQTECIIPQNYKGITNFLSFTFKTRNLIEGFILGAILAIITGSIVVYYDYGFSVRVITYAIIGFGLGAIIGVIGLNGESLSEFIVHLFRYLRKRRVTYYNPRVKTEARPMVFADGAASGSENMLPRDRLIAVAKKVMEPIRNKRGEMMTEQEAFNEEQYEFYDDDSVISEDAPKQSAFSRWKARRAAKKLEKKRKKLERRSRRNGKKRKPAGAR